MADDVLYVGSPVGWGSMRPETALYLVRVVKEDAGAAGFKTCQVGTAGYGRIMQARNVMVADAQKMGCTHMMMVDPDMLPDMLCAINNKRFVIEAKQFLDDNRLAIVGAPACSSYPERKLNVFKDDGEGNGIHYTHSESENMHGWQEVHSIGTGLVMFRLDMLTHVRDLQREKNERLPFFYDVYENVEHTDLFHTQDIAFCLTCARYGVKVYANFDCWCGHFKTSCSVPDFVATQLDIPVSPK